MASLESAAEPSDPSPPEMEPSEPPQKKRHPVTVSEKIQKAQEFRLKGNDLFKAGEPKKVRPVLQPLKNMEAPSLTTMTISFAHRQCCSMPACSRTLPG